MELPLPFDEEKQDGGRRLAASSLGTNICLGLHLHTFFSCTCTCTCKISNCGIQR